MLGIPSEEMSIGLAQVIFHHAHHQGNLRPRNYETWYKMSVMLQSGLDILPADHR